MNARLFFETDDKNFKSLQAVAFVGGSEVEISAEDEWCGSTETGFGATVGVTLSYEEALRMRDFLNKWLAGAKR